MALDRLHQGARFDPVQRGQVSIKQHGLAADDLHLGGNAFDRNETPRFGYLRTVSTSQRSVNTELPISLLDFSF